MKGQVFVITAVFVLIFILSLRINTQTSEATDDSAFLSDFENLRGELVRTVDFSLVNQQSVQSNLDDFIYFSSEFNKRKGYEQSVVYTVNSDASKVTVSMNVTLSSKSSYLMQSIIVNRTVV